MEMKGIKNYFSLEDCKLFFKNRHKLLLTIMILSIGLILGLLLTQTYLDKKRDEKHQDLANAAYKFTGRYLKKYKEKKIDTIAFLDLYRDNFASFDHIKPLVPLIFESIDEMNARKDYLSLVKFIKMNQKKIQGSFVNYLISLRLAVAYEDLDRTEEALVIYEQLVKSPPLIDRDYLYLSLGRIYLRMGHLKKAQRNLQYIVDHATEDSNIRTVASLYLEKLSQRQME